MPPLETSEPDSRLSGSNPLVRWVPVAAMVLLLVAVTRQAAMPLRDPDMWWHLQLGLDFRQGRSLSNPGEFGSFSTEAWVPTQWLPEVGASWVVEVAGLGALSWLFGVTLLALALVVYAGAREIASPLAAALAAGAVIVGGGGSLSPRPHMLTYILLALTIIAWLRSARDLKPRWWLIPLTWIWANSHGMWFIGPVTGAAVALGLLLDHPGDRRPVVRLLLLPIAGIAIAALTPVGPKLLGSPFAVSGISQFVTEWQPANFRELQPALVAATIAIVVVQMARARHVPWTHVALLLLAAAWTVLSARTVTIGAITIAPLFAGALQSVLPPRTTRVTRAEVLTLVATALVCLAVLAAVAPSETARTHAPRDLDPQLDALPSGTVIVNRDSLGGWLMWSHPHVRPVVDGLFESYSTNHLRSYVDAVRAVPGWSDFLDDVGASAALLGERDPLAGTLEDQLGWENMGTDSGWVLLVAPEVAVEIEP